MNNIHANLAGDFNGEPGGVETVLVVADDDFRLPLALPPLRGLATPPPPVISNRPATDQSWWTDEWPRP